MAAPYIMPLGFIDHVMEDGTVFLLTDPEESNALRTGTPITVWRYSAEHLAGARIRGEVSAVGYVTATFTLTETLKDPRWPEDLEILRRSAPVYLAVAGTFEPDLSRMLTKEQAERMQELARIYDRLAKPRIPERPKPGGRQPASGVNHHKEPAP